MTTQLAPAPHMIALPILSSTLSSIGRLLPLPRLGLHAAKHPNPDPRLPLSTPSSNHGRYLETHPEEGLSILTVLFGYEYWDEQGDGRRALAPYVSAAAAHALESAIKQEALPASRGKARRRSGDGKRTERHTRPRHGCGGGIETGGDGSSSGGGCSSGGDGSNGAGRSGEGSGGGTGSTNSPKDGPAFAMSAGPCHSGAGDTSGALEYTLLDSDDEAPADPE